MKLVCLDAKTLGLDIDLNLFQKYGEFIAYDYTSNDETIEKLKDVDIVITNKVLITDEVMAKTPIKLVCLTATGMNNVDLEAAKRRGVVVKNVANYSTNSVAQLTFAGLLYMVNKMKYYDNYVKEGKWAKSEIFTNLNEIITEISGKKFGIIGLGDIGKKVAQIAEAFGSNVCYYSTSGKNNNSYFKQVSFEELLTTCDIISIHAPLNDKTKNLIKATELAKLKENAIIMNFGRGGIINEADLAKAIDNSNLRAVIDVLEDEPMKKDHPFLKITKKENILITPHIAWGSEEARKILIDKVCQNIENFIKNI